jgi:hypothetical protein
MKLAYRFASNEDLGLLAEWNYQLIRDEGHRNPMTIQQLRKRMKEWLAGEYTAVVFHSQAEMIADALYREQEGEIYLSTIVRQARLQTAGSRSRGGGDFARKKI